MRYEYIAKNVPLNRILTESDGDVKYRKGIRGSPSVIPQVVNYISKLRNIEGKDIINVIWENYSKFLEL